MTKRSLAYVVVVALVATLALLCEASPLDDYVNAPDPTLGNLSFYLNRKNTLLLTNGISFE